MPRKAKTFSVLQNLRERYYISSKGKESLLKILLDVEIPDHVFNSNAIENSTLSLEETEKILLQIDLDRYISDREIFEAKNLARVVEYIDKKAHEQDLTLEGILFMHKMLLSNIRDDIAGRFREGNENVRVGTHIGASPTDIVNMMEHMMIVYKSNIHESIIERIARLHLTFEHIHPFGDGNGRIGRVIINYLLIREGYVPINIKFIDRAKYYNAFKQFDQSGKTEIMQEIVGRALTNSYYKRLAYLEDKKIVLLDEYAKRTKQSYANALNKARRQTIPAFLERGTWKVGVDRN
jgi:Fic family protein